jgi:hypothetical protein
MDKHSKWPIFMRMHGSVMPKMILPLVFVAAWSTFITLISKHVHSRKDFRTFNSITRVSDCSNSWHQQYPAHRAGFRGGSGFVVPQLDCI